VFADQQHFPFRLLCDTDRAMGLAFHACETATDQYPRRITYVVGPDETIEQAVETQGPGEQADQLLAHLEASP
jgi:peroxiredoxin